MLKYQGGTYGVTEADRLWLMRAVQAEGPPQLQVARALVNGFAWARAHRKWAGSLMGWVRAYAQPVNSRWFTSGDLHKKQVAEVADAAARAQLERRAYEREAKHATRQAFAPEVEAAVNEALTTPWASDITDYAAPAVDASKKGYVARSAPRPGQNRFWTRAVGWTGYVGNGWASGGGAGVALALLVGLWLLTKGRA